MTIKELEFCNLYIKNKGNGSQAYREAYNKPNLHPSQASTRSYELLQISYINDKIEELRKETMKAHDIDRDRMVKYYLRLVEAWEELWELGKKENKTKEEIQRFYLCKDLVKGSDYKSCLAEISKLTGLYQPEKVEIKDTSHTTEWG